MENLAAFAQAELAAPKASQVEDRETERQRLRARETEH